MKKIITYSLYIFAFTALFVSFDHNHWNSTTMQWFNSKIADDFLVIGKLLSIESGSSFKQEGPFMGYYVPRPKNISTYHHYLDYYSNKKKVPDDWNYVPYYSQSGIQTLVFQASANLCQIDYSKRYRFFQTITSIALSLTILLLLRFVQHEFGTLPVLLVTFLTISSPWLVGFGRGLYWSFWSFLLPFAVLINILNQQRANFSTLRISIYSFLLFLLPCFFMGFAFVTTTAIMTVVPAIYHALAKGWHWKKFYLVIKGIVFGTSSAILASLLFLYGLISIVRSDSTYAFNHIKNSFLKRSSGNSASISSEHLNQNIIDSLNSNTFDIVIQYFKGSSLDFTYLSGYEKPLSISFFILFLIVLVLFLFDLGLGYLGQQGSSLKRTGSIYITTLISVVCPISWFVFFKAHSYLHPHTDYLVWYLPFSFLAYISISYTISLFTKFCYLKVRKYYVK